MRQECTNFGVLLEEVNDPLSVSMHQRMGWFPVVVTGIKAPAVTQKLPFAFVCQAVPPESSRVRTSPLRLPDPIKFSWSERDVWGKGFLS